MKQLKERIRAWWSYFICTHKACNLSFYGRAIVKECRFCGKQWYRDPQTSKWRKLV